MRTLHVFLSVFASSLAFLLLPQNAYAACTLTSASWSQTNVVPGNGQQVNMQVFGNDCTNTVVHIEVYSGSQKVNTTYTAIFPSDGRASTEAPFALSDAIWNQLGGGENPSIALSFKVRVGNQTPSVQSSPLSFQKPFLAITPAPSSTASPAPITTDKTLGGMIAQVYEWAILLLGAIMFFMIVKSGFTILMNADNPSAVTKARSDIQDVFVGALFLLAAYAILKTINPDLVNFQQNLPPLPTPTPRS